MEDAAKKVDEIAFPPPLDLDARFLLKPIPGGGPAIQRLPIVVLFQFVQPFIPLGLPPRHDTVQSALTDLAEILVKRHAPVEEDHGAGARAVPFFQRVERRLETAPVRRIAVENRMRIGNIGRGIGSRSGTRIRYEIGLEYPWIDGEAILQT